MAAYTFEHVNRRKATHINADTRDLLQGRHKYYDPDRNYLSGDGKSVIWKGHSYYVPNDRSWRLHHQVRALPNERIPDLVEFQSEDSWREWQAKRDAPGSGVVCGSSGFRFSGKPELKLSGYCFNPYNLYRTGVPATTYYKPHNPWPKTDTRRFPTWRGPPGYYGYHQEELDIHHDGGYRFPRDAKTLKNDEDLMKYEYMRLNPSIHNKTPANFPVLQ